MGRGKRKMLIIKIILLVFLSSANTFLVLNIVVLLSIVKVNKTIFSRPLKS